jgi:hypothetical protein
MPRYLDPKADVPKELLDVPEIAQAVQLSEESAYTSGELEVYESYWDSIRREKTLIGDKYAEGKAEGIKMIAINMLKANKPLEEISSLTGLSQETLIQLQNEIT